MSIYIVSYDLVDQKNYEVLISKIKKYGAWAKPLESFWLVKTSDSASEIRDNLKTVMDNDDKLIVIEAGSTWATKRISGKVTDWIQEHF